jgi:hypothetical protein
VLARLDAVEEEIYQVKNRSPRDTLNYPIKLNNQLAVLQTYVDTGSSRPTDQEYAVFKELTGNLDAILARLGQVVNGDLARLNTGLTSAGFGAGTLILPWSKKRTRYSPCFRFCRISGVASNRRSAMKVGRCGSSGYLDSLNFF